jgi:hypothetical protein
LKHAPGEESTNDNRTCKKLAVHFSADSFVVKETFVLRNNICGKNRQQQAYFIAG